MIVSVTCVYDTDLLVKVLFWFTVAFQQAMVLVRILIMQDFSTFKKVQLIVWHNLLVLFFFLSSHEINQVNTRQSMQKYQQESNEW